MRLLAALIAVSTAACTNDMWRPLGEASAPEPMPPATTTTYDVAVGASTSVAAGQASGYSVTALGPKTYRIVWTGDTTTHEFAGSIWTRGQFTTMTPGCADGSCSLEAQDRLSGVIAVDGGERIDWDTFASVGFDGFDVETDGAPIYLDVSIDGVRAPAQVALPANGGKDVSPTSAPFGVRAH
jgi:hypothetical protein